MALCVAILGVGHWHAARYSTALAAAGVVVVAVSDHEPAVAARRGSELGCRSYDDHHALLAAEQPDFVVALPRPCDGAALVHDLLERGLPCLIEKPVVRRAAELAPLVARMQQQRAFVAVPFIGRLSPIWKVPAEDTADLLHGQLRIINGPPERYAQAGCGWMLDPAQAGGGALRNLGIHLADAAIHLAGRLDIIAARIGYGAYAIDEYAVALLETANGAQLQLEAGYTFPLVAAGMSRGGDTCWRIVSRNAYMIDDEATFTMVQAQHEQRSPSPSSAERYERYMIETLDRWRRGMLPHADLADCYAAAQLIDRIYDQAQSCYNGAASAAPYR